MEKSWHDARQTHTDRQHTPQTGKFPYPVVGICAAASDAQSLHAFFGAASTAVLDMAFVLLLANDLDPADVATSLRKVTAMPVTIVPLACPALSLQRNQVYMVPSWATPSLGPDTVEARDADTRHGGDIPMLDPFLRGLADAHHGRAMAVILSGVRQDARAGLACIKEGGGIVIAQSRPDAFPVAPQGDAGLSDLSDFALAVADMPAKLRELWDDARSTVRPVPRPDSARAIRRQLVLEGEHALQEILAALLARTGHDFGHYKRATLLRRIKRRVQIHALPDLFAYRDFILASPAEAEPLLQDLLIGVTHFFRDRDAFAALQRDVLPSLFEETLPSEPLRVWIPGCSTGEEAYSIAILLRAHAEKRGERRSMQLFATDIDARAIGHGRLGRYSDAISADLTPDLLLEHFHAEPRHYQVTRSLRKLVLFARHDMLRDPPFAHQDLVSCRNLLIYLDPVVQRRVLQQFHFALRPGGYLFLGGAEDVDVAQDLFEVVDKRHRIYRRKFQAHSRHLPPVRSLAAAQALMPPIDTPAAPMLMGALHEQAMLRYGPPSIIVDRQHDVLHISERAACYLRHVGGEPSQWLPGILLPELKDGLRTALLDATRSGREANTAPVTLLHGGRPVRITISVHPVTLNADARTPACADDSAIPSPRATPSGTNDPFALVVFHETDVARDTPSGNGDTAHAAAGGGARDRVIEELEQALHEARQQVWATRLHADGSTEALKASNDDLQAMNEELHSMTEELETGKEELQSINEELLTVNAELQAKIQESGKVNDDLINLISSSNIATLFVSRSMVLNRYTPAATALFNVIPSDIGRSLLDITHRLDYPDLASDAAATFDSLRLIEKEVAGPDGRWYLSRLSPYRTAGDRIEGAVLTLIDITSRRDAQEKMRISERRMQLVAQSTDDYAIIVHDMSGAIVTWNKGAERMFGYSEAEILGQPGQMIYAEEDRRAGVGDAEVRRALTQGRSRDEGWLMRKDGTRLYCSGVTTALHGDDFHGYAKIARDLTDGQTAESTAQLQHSLERSVRQQVDTANRLKDEFLAVLSHELKNPLNLIHVKAEMLSRAPDARDLPVVQEAADAIRRSVAAQAKIIDDLLDLSRVRTGKLTLDEEPVDVARIIDSATDALEGDAAAAGLTLTASGTREQAIVLGDETRIEQIVWNLLSNALKFTPAGGRIEVALTQDAEHACISVTDTGQGIEPSFLPHIFDMFSQAESAFNRARGGLGIGLALVQQLTQMQGGRVSAESEGNGHGACFRVWLRRSHTGARIASSQGPADATVLHGKRILLVDDTLETLEAFRVLLEMEGASVHVECSGQDALRAVTDEHFDIILSDIGMPGMDGYELVRALRNAPDTATIPAVAITGFGRAQDIDRALDAGFDAHLGKPVSLDALLRAIGDALTTPR